MKNFFKQYGELRTGTNYLKRLIELNFEDCTVFGSVLGWKHGTYDLNNREDRTSSHKEWVEKKTRDGVVYSVDDLPLRYSPDMLVDCIDHLNYIFSIKKPIPFILSYKKFRLPNKPLTDQHIINLCRRYNDRYRTWLSMYLVSGGVIVPYESLIMDIGHILLSLELKYGLERTNNTFTDESSPVKASTDVGLIIDRKSKFNKDYYLAEEYMKEISPHQVRLIESLIDHELVESLYKRGL